MNLAIRKLIGHVTRLLYPGYGTCYMCGRPWAVAKYHDTPYSNYSSCSPLCEACWSELRPIERLPYYLRLFVNWIASYPDHQTKEEWMEEWNSIQEAVMDGK